MQNIQIFLTKNQKTSNKKNGAFYFAPFLLIFLKIIQDKVLGQSLFSLSKIYFVLPMLGHAFR